MSNRATYRWVRIWTAACLATAAVGVEAADVEAAKPTGSTRPAAPQIAMTDQIIVEYSAGATRPAASQMARFSGTGVRRSRALDARRTVIKLSGPMANDQLSRVLRTIEAQPGVLRAEPDTIMVPLATPNDPSFATQWDFSDPAISGFYGVNASGAWDISTGAEALTIAVIDTGYLDHADLAGRIVGGYDFVSDSRLSNDGNARDADAHDPGDWISAEDKATAFFAQCPISNSSWHGTHVAGTIGAATDNSLGIAGLNRKSKLIAVRVLGKCGGYSSDIVDGMKWAAGLPVTGVAANPNPARVLNLSLGGVGVCSSTYQAAIDQITAAGVVVVVAAGNSNANSANYNPASCSGIITVAATGKAGSRAYYSNFGTSVEIAAPGGDSAADAGDTILSTLNSGATVPVSDSYAKYQGTSMATPHVVGVVSLMLSVNPSLTPAQVTATIQQSARPFPAGSSCTTSLCGTGILNAAAAVGLAANPPPTAPSAFNKTSPANATTRVRRPVRLSWAASSGATSYQYCIDTSNDSACTLNNWVSTTATSASPLLGSATTYYWQVRALNTVGATNANAGTWWRFGTR